MGIDTYLTVAFWLGIIGVALRGVILICCEYPRITKTSVGSDTMQFIVQAFFLAWVCYLRFYS